MSEVTEEQKMTQAQLDQARATELVAPLSAAGKSDDEIVVALITAGFTFKQAGRLMQSSLEGLGVRMSSKERNAHVEELLVEHGFAPTEWSDVTSVVTWIAEQLDATDEKQAMKSVVRFAKENEIELPAKPKKAPGGGGLRADSFRGQMHQYMIDNPTGEESDLVAFVEALGKDKGHARHWARIYDTAKQMAAKIAAA